MKQTVDDAQALVKIRPMQDADIDAVILIDRLSFQSTWTKDSYQRDLANPHCFYFVVEKQGVVMGYAGMWVVQEDSHITTIAVHPLWRRKGFGKILLEEMIQTAITRGAHKMTLEVRVSNFAAQHLYEQYGFAPIAQLKHYYLDNGEDALVMSCNPLTKLEP